MPDFSCADYTFPLLSRIQVLRLLRLLEFESIDIGLFERNSRFCPSQLKDSPTDFTRSVLEGTQSAGLNVSDVFLQVGLEPQDSSANDPSLAVRTRNREVFSYALGFCRALGCAHMTGLPGVHHGNAQRDFEVAAEEAAWRLDQCRQAGIVYSIEPHIGSICADTTSVHKLLASVKDLTLTLDYGHFICLGEDSAAVHTLIPHASHIHTRCGARGRLQTSLPDNTIDFEAMISCLFASHYQGMIALEYVWTDWQGCNRSDNLSETILLRQRLRDIFDLNRKA
jgi:sugar phosphate isomerase/epimerase